ncbi:N-6 DNA methylase [Armatimonas rosea]|uniref:site-specific DNA-methyltransferase (adenine-specific) n=1 Tax=Armatimonas rosea TaxID=685828 RepID=A0A7W9SPG2_ARMRO|nr:N-6 DNA methylase [Armatimonas rosea]MBB6050437.1 type I restriction enzyme M protein [Armatimonas rosea]
MLSPQLRSQVNDLWEMFWSSGMTNPLTAIEQITYLILLKRLEGLDDERVKPIEKGGQGKPSLYGSRRNCTLPHHPILDGEVVDGICPGHNSCRWSVFSQDPEHDLLSQYVFPWLRRLDETFEVMGNGAAESQRRVAGYLEDAYFGLPPEKASTLIKAVGMVNRLFDAVGKRGANADLMGDIFEHLLSEISTSGKNGQFRTPRHIIRFLVELLDPKPSQRVVDPAAGSGGFLINTIQHLLVQASDSESVVYEWDGTPHRYTGGIGTEQSLAGRNFVGYDNDRTMVRIGWMNLILHGIENPEIVLRDALGPKLMDQAEYSLALANPPFTGSIDEEDLHERFLVAGKKNKVALTNKTELLFVWLLLDLLETGGRAAVIIPEGVLFGSAGAHRELRRQLLFEHELEAVISLPGGVFQPYTGVKTSVLIFQKVGQKHKREEMPRTKRVWFYEVESDGYSLDAKRNGQPTGDNDLWDALHKFRNRETLGESEEYFQPEVYQARWRTVDTNLIASYSHLAPEEGQIRGITELWRDLPEDLAETTRSVSEAAIPILDELVILHYGLVLAANANKRGRKSSEKAMLQTALKDLRAGLTGTNSKIKNNLERGDGSEEHAWKALRAALDLLDQRVLPADSVDEDLYTLPAFITEGLPKYNHPQPTNLFEGPQSGHSVGFTAEHHVFFNQLEVIKLFMKLDGYNVQLLRSRAVAPSLKPEKKKVRSWWVDVRVLARHDEWTNKEETIKGSHDANGNLRPEFLADDRIYNPDGTVKSVYLERGCIEADDLNLSAGRYRPLNLDTEEYAPPAEIIKGLQAMEGQIQEKLKRLLEMVEGVS